MELVPLIRKGRNIRAPLLSCEDTAKSQLFAGQEKGPHKNSTMMHHDPNSRTVRN